MKYKMEKRKPTQIMQLRKVKVTYLLLLEAKVIKEVLKNSVVVFPLSFFYIF